jgi:SPP1 family phage portal protein
MEIVRFEDFYIEPNKPITDTDIINFVGKKQCQKPFMDMLENYYLGRHNILSKAVVDVTMPTNRIVTNFCQVIVDFYNTYLLGRPVQYKSNQKDMLEIIKEIMEYNDAHETDMLNNQNANIFGSAAEQVYIDKDGEFRFCNVDYRNVIFIYNKNVEKALAYVIKYWKYNSTDKKYACEVWSATDVVKLELDEGLSQVRRLETVEHSFGDVPFIEYMNNNYRFSSFSSIITLQDAYNTLTSSEIDDYESFVDAFLAIYNAAGTNDDDIAAMKKNRVLLLDGESKAEWLVKNCNPAQIESIKADIMANIHKVASLPDLSDENFAGNASGVAIKYKMVGAENVAARQERKFRKGLQRRIELIMNYLRLTGVGSYDWRDVNITFNRNMIGADLEIAQLINLVGERIPIANLAQQLSFITDADMNLIKKAEEDRIAPSGKAQDALPLEDKTEAVDNEDNSMPKQ